jgi:hypothetical protein
MSTTHHHSKMHLTFKAVKAVIPFRHRRSRAKTEAPELTEEEKRAVIISMLPDEHASRPSSSATPSDRSPTPASAEPESESSSEDSSAEEEQELEPELADDESFHLPSPTRTPEIAASMPAFISTTAPSDEKAEIAAFIAEHGSSSSTSWLEFSRYKIWRPSHPIAGSTFLPVQGYLRADPYVFAWGNPLVSDKAALGDTAVAFWEWARGEGVKIVWCCADDDLEAVLGKDPRFNWAALSCIVEDMLDPAAVVELAHSAANGSSEVKDFKKNLRRAERENVLTREVREDEWTADIRREVEEGILAWKKAKSKTGLQLASVRLFLSFFSRICSDSPCPADLLPAVARRRAPPLLYRGARGPRRRHPHSLADQWRPIPDQEPGDVPRRAARYFRVAHLQRHGRSRG